MAGEAKCNAPNLSPRFTEDQPSSVVSSMTLPVISTKGEASTGWGAAAGSASEWRM